MTKSIKKYPVGRVKSQAGNNICTDVFMHMSNMSVMFICIASYDPHEKSRLHILAHGLLYIEFMMYMTCEIAMTALIF